MELYEEIEKIFPVMKKIFTRPDLLNFKNTRVGDLYLYHFGMDTWIRNHLLCPQENDLYRLFLENNITHPDDMSSIVIRLFHKYLSQKI